MAQPGDSETLRAQKKVVIVVALVGCVATLLNAVPLFGGGLIAMSWAYVASAVYILIGTLILLAWPRGYRQMSFILLLDVFIFTTLGQVLSGGFASGMYSLIWVLFAPVGAALVLGTRSVLAMLVGFVLSVLVVAWLEPYSISIAPEISPAVRVRFNVSSLLSLGLILTAASLILLRQVERYRLQADTLLYNILPESIANRLKGGAPTIADSFDNVTILFADIENFTSISAVADPADIVNLLNRVFSDFDELAAKYGLEKIKTIGDSYMVAAGVPVPRDDHIDCIISFAQDMLAAIKKHPDLRGAPLSLRIGINTGPVVAGVIGRQKFSYDMWGDTVNVASRMEQHGAANRIQVTQRVKDKLDNRYAFEERAPIPIKGKGMMVTYFLADNETPSET